MPPPSLPACTGAQERVHARDACETHKKSTGTWPNAPVPVDASSPGLPVPESGGCSCVSRGLPRTAQTKQTQVLFVAASGSCLWRCSQQCPRSFRRKCYKLHSMRTICNRRIGPLHVSQAFGLACYKVAHARLWPCGSQAPPPCVPQRLSRRFSCSASCSAPCSRRPRAKSRRPPSASHQPLLANCLSPFTLNGAVCRAFCRVDK